MKGQRDTISSLFNTPVYMFREAGVKGSSNTRPDSEIPSKCGLMVTQSSTNLKAV